MTALHINFKKLKMPVYLLFTFGAASLSFLKFGILANKLPPADFGLYSLVMTTYVLIIYLGSLGANEHMLKTGSKFFAQNNEARISQLRTNCIFYGLLTTSACSIVLLISVFIAGNNQALKVVIFSILIALPALSYNIFESYFRCTQQYIIFSSVMFLKAVVLIVFIISFTEKFGVEAVIAGESLGFLLSFIVMILIVKEHGHSPIINSPIEELKYIIKNGLSSLLSYLSRNIALTFDKYFISLALGLAALGTYSFTMLIYQAAILASGICTNILGPKWLANYHKNDDVPLLIKGIKRASFYVFMASILAFPIFYLLLPSLIEQYFKNYYSDEIISMSYFLYFSSVAYVITAFLDWYFIAASKEYITLSITMLALTLIIALFFIINLLNLPLLYFAGAFFITRLITLIVTIVLVSYLSVRRKNEP